MKFKIFDSEKLDSFIIEGDNIEELRIIANKECLKRNWKKPFSILIK